MRRYVALLLVFGLLAAVQPASAAKKKKPAAKPVRTVLYLDGTSDLGEQDQDPTAMAYLDLNAAEPDGAAPKSIQVWGAAVTPNTSCAGNSLFPVFVGQFTGTITGPIKVTVHAASTPGGSVQLQFWPDVASQLCDSDVGGTAAYTDPAASTTVSMPIGPGVIEAETDAATFSAQAVLMFQITPVLVPPFYGRVLYDSADYASKIEFDCIPAKGAKSCV